MKEILIIIGSAGKPSANQQLVSYLASLLQPNVRITIFDELKMLPPFDPNLSIANTPDAVITFRHLVTQSYGIIICTPEYIFSVPSGLKNALEWCVATTVFSDKLVGLITASAHGVKAHEELQLIMKTLGAVFTDETTLLVQGVKGKIDTTGAITDSNTEEALRHFTENFRKLLSERFQ